MESAKRRDQLIEAVDFGRYRNKVLLAALLERINRFKPGECYESQESLARRLKTSTKTIQRALERLAELDLVVVQKRNRRFADGTTKSVNHYGINWTELERLVDSQRSKALGQSSVAMLPRTKATVCTEQSDSSSRALGQLAPTVETPSCPAMNLRVLKTTTTEPVVVVDESLIEASQPKPVQPNSMPKVVENSTTTEHNRSPDTFDLVRDRLKQYKPVGVVKSDQSVDAAMMRGWTVDYCNRLIEFATKKQTPAGHLCRWFVHGSPPEEFARLEAIRRTGGPLRSGPKFDPYKHRQERLANQAEYRDEIAKAERLRNSEARA